MRSQCCGLVKTKSAGKRIERIGGGGKVEIFEKKISSEPELHIQNEV